MTDTLNDIIPDFGPLDSVEPANQFDWLSAKELGARGALAVDVDLDADIALTAKRTKTLLANHLRGHHALNEALACVFQFAERNRHRPAMVIAALRNAGMPVTRATLNSPYLPFVRLLLPSTTSALQSRYASGLAYLATERCLADKDIASEITRRGGIEACARAFANTRPRQSQQKPVDDPLVVIRSTYAPVPIIGDAAALLPAGKGVGLLIVERTPTGEAVAYAHVGKDALTAQALRQAWRSRPA